MPIDLAELLRNGLANSPHVHVLLDGTADGVVLPEQLRKDRRVMLALGPAEMGPEPKIDIDEIGFRVTLAFGTVPTDCIVPWSAVYGLQGTFAIMVREPPKEEPKLRLVD